MNILCIYPVLDPEINSVAHALLHLGRKGHHLLVITVRKAISSKGIANLDERSEYGNVVICRPFNRAREQYSGSSKALKKALRFVGDFRPDLVFCSLQHNMPLAERLARHFCVPVVLLVEFARNPAYLLPIRGIGLLNKFHLSGLLTPLARIYWNSLSRRTSGIIVTNFADRPYLKQMTLPGREVVYIPWCNQIPTLPKVQREKYTAIHVGGLTRFKNAQELCPAIVNLLEETNTQQFTVVGPGKYAKDVIKLTYRYPNRVFYIPHMSRRQVLEHMSRATYAFLPAKEGALGFIGDCWGVSLPLVSLYNPGGILRQGKDALVCGSVKDLAGTVNDLLEDSILYHRLSVEGHARYLSENSAKAVGNSWEKVFLRTLKIST